MKKIEWLGQDFVQQDQPIKTYSAEVVCPECPKGTSGWGLVFLTTLTFIAGFGIAKVM